MGSPSGQLRRAVVSGYLGSVIEFYDFMLYATASAVVFSKVFFSSLDPAVATIASFGTLATGYIARPLGGVIFGHFGDLLGRKRMLVLSMTLMGLASFLIGLLPTYRQIGVWAPIGLVALRLVQGVSVGGEWGGAVLMSAEHATSRRGLWASFGNAGAPSGILLSTVVLSATSALVGEDAFLAWGWRIPFLVSLLLLAVGLFVRLRVTETPAFEVAKRQARTRRFPVVEVLRRHPRTLLLGIGVGLAAFVAQATMTIFVIAYGVRVGHTRQDMLNALTISTAFAIFGILGWSALTDRVGRKPVVVAGALAMAGYSFLLFPLVQSSSFGAVVLALTLGNAVIQPMIYGPLAALYAELFSTENRYTGASLGYQLASLGAGFAPLLFAQVQQVTGSSDTVLISATISAFCLLSVACIAALKETSRRDLQAAPAPVLGKPAASGRELS
ncbi:MFS transporter [Amycolatopsis rhabdoformis]|uniref:MFS transporter n=1 Tax=Amycolatopsis rhabdoformis TaxID=1448059 RepID=A0ABZ1IDG4_9PSEU|nr:MFS transporter [Amycolatopsis rhabdoformis]WSE32506.1 MFS transporter [Amycolatopsis rhabdoformis]